MVTLAKIAKESGFSIPVVSRALSPKQHKDTRMAEETRLLIQDVAKHLGYQPNRNAEFLKRGQSPVIACFLPSRPDSLLARLMKGISEEAAANHFSVTFCFEATKESYANFLKEAKKSKSCGVITYPYFKRTLVAEQIMSEYRDGNGKIVLIEGESRDWKWKDSVSVSVDDYHGGELAAKRLLARGATRFFTLQFDLIPERIQGFVDTLNSIDTKTTVFDSSTSSCVVKMANAVKAAVDSGLSGNVGCFLPRDSDASDIMNALWDLGVKPGKDVFVIGYDDQHLARHLRPTLTTVSQPFERVGRLAIRKLIDTIYDKKSKSELLKPKLILRDSA